MKTKYTKKTLVVTSILIVVLVICSIVFMYNKNSILRSLNIIPAFTANTITQPNPLTASPSNTADPYIGWLQYCSKQEKSCFKYPTTWTTKDVGSVDPGGDGISLISPNGTYLWFQSAVSGLGGTCNPDNDPHVFIEKVIAEPHVSNLYIVETKYGNTGNIIHIGLVNGVDGNAPQTGDIGYCLYYTTFKSQHDPSMSAWFEINGNGSAYLKADDIPTVELILKSYTY